jgi:hypothetical protein
MKPRNLASDDLRLLLDDVRSRLTVIEAQQRLMRAQLEELLASMAVIETRGPHSPEFSGGEMQLHTDSLLK